MVVQTIDQLIGNTPVVKLNKIAKNLEVDIYLKLEWYNPGGSVKDRIAKSMIEAAENSQLLTKGDTIIEPTSGNTGIGLAMIAAAKGYRIILAMPETVSIERRKILEGYGAEVLLIPADKGMKGAIATAKELADKHGYFMPMQFDNLNNPKIHMETTAKEIIKDFEELHYFIVGVGTGGTITGCGSILKEHYPGLSIKAVEPKGSAVLSGNEPGPHKIQGIGAGFVPSILNQDIYDEVIQVTDNEAIDTARKLAKEEGLFVGISTGANVAACLKVAEKARKKSILLTVSPSNAERYLSTVLFEKNE